MSDHNFTTSKLRSDIEVTKGQISSTVDELSTKLTEMKDWRYMVRTYPLASLGLCLGLGFIATRLIAPPHRAATEKPVQIVKESKNPITDMILSAAIGFVVTEGKKAAQNALYNRFSRRASLRDLN